MKQFQKHLIDEMAENVQPNYFALLSLGLVGYSKCTFISFSSPKM